MTAQYPRCLVRMAGLFLLLAGLAPASADPVTVRGTRPIPPPVTLVAVLPDAGLVGWTQVTDAAAPATLDLVPGAYGTVHVTEPQGRPLAGVQFQAWWWPPEEKNWVRTFNLPAPVSDDQGNAKFGPLPPGKLRPCLPLLPGLRRRVEPRAGRG